MKMKSHVRINDVYDLISTPVELVEVSTGTFGEFVTSMTTSGNTQLSSQFLTLGTQMDGCRSASSLQRAVPVILSALTTL
jgi:hypothetical protein